MHNYKSDYYNPLTLERTQIETEIPVNLVKGLKEALDGLEDYNITPTMINPENSSVVFGIMDMKDRSLKYKVTISANTYENT